ncbi:hypothetical protein CSB63_1912 [Streptococcus thermophilus]|nr:hypothetical protein CSB63_1912 [Streptococcus thermophilus]
MHCGIQTKSLFFVIELSLFYRKVIITIFKAFSILFRKALYF